VKLWVIAEGKLRDPALRQLCDRYLSRLQRYVSATEVEVRDARALERAIPDGARTVALEVDGEALSSSAFSARLGTWLAERPLAFVIGGAEGLPAPLSESAERRLSLSPMTLPHRLARVVLFEQLYRAMTILRGEPYAREG
jgi:23S rRNA (pseudouridine1915-N3)-methyltransferase